MNRLGTLVNELWASRNNPPQAEIVIAELYKSFPRNREAEDNVQCYDGYRKDIDLGYDEPHSYKWAMQLRRQLHDLHQRHQNRTVRTDC